MMEKASFKSWFGKFLQANGFQKSHGNWCKATNEVTKMVNLQKSNFANVYYINYGFLLNKLEIPDLLMHVYYRLSSENTEERRRIDELLDLDSDIGETQRKAELERYLARDVIACLDRIDTEHDLSSELLRRPHLNSVPLAVKEHLKLT
jgi:hypothetical protein